MLVKVLNMHDLHPDKRALRGFVRIDRATKWGNPFKISRTMDRDEVCQRYEAWFEQQPELIAALPEIANAIAVLCWCAPKRCHGDFLVRRANAHTE